MSKRSFVDFGRRTADIARAASSVAKATWRTLGSQSDFGEALAAAKPKHPATIPGISVRAQFPRGTPTAQIPKAGEKLIVIEDDEAVVKTSVVDHMQEVGEMIDFWTERGLWVSKVHMPAWEKTREYIERLEAEVEELRLARDLGRPVEDLT